MYRKILIPVSTASQVEPLIRFAANLLGPEGEIRVLHVIPTLTIPEVTKEWRSSVNIVIPAHETGAALDIPVQPEVRSARDVPGEILEVAESEEDDAILFTLGSDRRSRNPFVGHTATALLQHARCDVIIVNRLALLDNSLTKILIPSFSPNPPRKAVMVAEQLSVRSGGIPLVTLHLSESSGTSSDSASTTDRGVPMRTRSIHFPSKLLHRGPGLPSIILSEAAKERYGLCLVAEDPQRTEGPLLTRRFLEELFRQAPCPVMALRD